MINALEDIGFYTLSEQRAKSASATSPMQRCELLITGRCNFNCSYCRGPRPEFADDIPIPWAEEIINLWARDELKNIRFSGGEPTLHPGLPELVAYARALGIERIAVSTNGSASEDLYDKLLRAGVNDFSVSLDACCAGAGNAMSGTEGQYGKVIENIKHLAAKTYVTVGVVVIEESLADLVDTVQMAHNLGVADIRIISAAQYNKLLDSVSGLSSALLDAHPILRYRVENIQAGRNVRGLKQYDCHKCHLVKDDSVVAGDWHFPCIINMREGGDPIGGVGPHMREQRMEWFEDTDTFANPICRGNCLDVCIDYNNACELYTYRV